MARHPLERQPFDPASDLEGAAEPIDEVMDVVGSEIARCAARANNQARLIESTGTLAFNITAELHRNAAPDDLVQRAHGLQSLAMRGLSLLAELQSEAGKLESLAAVRGAATDAGQQSK